MQVLARAAFLAALIACAGHARAQDKSEVPPRELQAKLTYCKTCHGPSGQGYRGAAPMPRLAGQQPEYFQNQLKAFDEHRRQNPIMFNVAHALSPAMLSALAAHFQSLNPKPLGGAPSDVAPEGKKIYEQGAGDIPPCSACHGPKAEGNGMFPRLAGQLHDYIIGKLSNWSKERGQDPKNPDNSAIMEPIAHGLSVPQVKAIAGYLSRLD